MNKKDREEELLDEYVFLQRQKNWLRKKIKECDHRQDEIKKEFEENNN